MSTKQHIVALPSDERAELHALIRAGSAPARRLARARILRKADAGPRGPRWSDVQIGAAVAVRPRTVARPRAAVAAGGLAAASRARTKRG